MCGICGIAGPDINVWDLDILNELAYVSGLRGRESTGVFQGRSISNLFGKSVVKNLVIKKSPHDVAFFQRYHKFAKDGNKEVLKGVTNNFFCVHTRSPTIGAVSAENAHPFEFSRYIGCHNGTLADFKYNDKTKTDSELFIKDMNDNGIIPTLKKLSSHSAYAIVLLDKENGKLYFARNNQRPLHVAVNRNRGVIYWASEEWMIKAICDRNKEYLVDDETRFFQTNSVYSVHPEEIRKGVKALWNVETFTPKPLVHHYGRSGWDSGFEEGFTAYRPFAEREKEKEKQEKESNIISLPDLRNKLEIKTQLDNKIPVAKCCICSKTLSLMDQFYATKISDTTYIHKGCEEITEEVKVG